MVLALPKNTGQVCGRLALTRWNILSSMNVLIVPQDFCAHFSKTALRLWTLYMLIKLIRIAKTY